MNKAEQQAVQQKSLALENFPGLQWRLTTLLGFVLPITILVVVIGLSYLFMPLRWEIWLLLGAGLFLLGLLAVWVTTRTLRQYITLALHDIALNLEKQNNQARHPAEVASNLSNLQVANSPPTEAHSKNPGPLEAIAQFQPLSSAELELNNHKKMAESLKESKTRYQQLVEFFPDGIIIIYDEVKISFINPAGVKLLGATQADEVIDKSIINFVHPNYQPAVKKWLQQRGTAAAISRFELKLMRADQSELEVEMVGIAFQHHQKSTIQFVVHNITKRKQTEAEISQRNRELTILQSAGVAITSRLDLRYVLDTVAEEMTRLVGIENCIIFEWNQTENIITQIAQYGSQGWWDSQSEAAVYDLAKYPLTRSTLEEQIPEQMTIKQSSIDPAELAYMQTAKIKTLLMLPMIFQRQVLGLVKLEDTQIERTFTYQEISMVKLLANQAASAIYNAQLFKQAQQEIKERQQAEIALEKERALLAQRVKERTADLSKVNVELARASRLKDEFLANMSHELRTPLNTILGSAEIMQVEVFGSLNEKQHKYAHNIEESGRHLLSLINDILDLSKVSAGKIELELGPVSVEHVCQASLRLVKQLAHQKQLNISTAYNNSVTIFQVDERRLKQILVNLLSNAIKFTPEGGEIGLEVNEDEAQQILYFTVWDNGIGIAKEDMEKLFQPFMQLDSRLSRQYEGTGLGLSLVSRMVELHGGGVSVESEVGQGSRFMVSFPCSKPATASKPNKETITEIVNQQELTNKPNRKAALILLVDDNEHNIMMLLGFLQVQNYRVTIARSGDEAIERAKEEKPDMILMDVQMPGMNGLEATRLIRSDVNLAQTPVIAMTALAMPGDREKCLQAGANDYISKPISPIRLIKIIETHL